MRKVLATIALIALMIGFSFHALGVGAYPHPIVVTQPDGTQVTIQIHGDEFLHWTTSGNRLVERAPDGFVYYASFDADGYIRRSFTRVGAGSGAMSVSPFSKVIPPAAAVQRAVSLREKASKATAQAEKSVISSGQNRYLVILAEFNDLHFTLDAVNTAFDNLQNQKGYSTNGATGSVRDYYEENSRGAFKPIFDVKGPVRVSQNYAYYGANDSDGDDIRPREFIAEVCQKLKADDPTFNFADYDIDGDGYVDNVFVYYAGHNEAEGGGAETIWPHKWALTSPLSIGGVYIWEYACTSEYKGVSGTTMCGIGTFCHEFGHVIGLPDFYDTDNETNGHASALGPFSLMSSGNYNNKGRTPPYLNAEERKILEWMGEPTEITGTTNISALSIDNNEAYMIKTANEGEYFLFEARKNSGWDNTSNIASGLLIYHVDKSSNIVSGITARNRWNNGYGINSVFSHQCMDLVETVPEADVVNSNDRIFPGRASSPVTAFTPSTTPAFKDWAGNGTGFSITNIARTSEGASFTVTYSETNSIKGRIVNSSDQPLSGKIVSLDLYSDDVNFSNHLLASDANGYFSYSPVDAGKKFVLKIAAEGVSANEYAAYDSGDLYTVDGITTVTVRLLKTRENVILSHGFSLINSAAPSYSNGETFTFNALYGGETPVSTNWTYDGAPKNDGTSVVLTTGTHTVIATLTYSDGRVETIEKIIVVR